MPLYQSKSGSTPLALHKDKDRIVAYLLTPKGASQLRSAGVRSGQKFPARILAHLIRGGHAHSPRLADAAGQTLMSFTDEDMGSALPRCELTQVTTDIHLVVYGDGTGTQAKLLAPEPRFTLQKVTTLSIPVGVLTLDALDHLELSQKMPRKTPAASTLRSWLRQDLQTIWDKFVRDNSAKQTSLPLDPDETELKL
jgi:hypothetical protein